MGYMYEVGLGLIIGLVGLAAITKRAQIPFSAWLPAAMAAPTPISALVHSSTLVTAGVYLLIRFRDMLGVRLILLVVSVSTIFISGLGANFEIDLKKIIALSTLRQLGVIMISLSLGLTELAYFHLLTHALFKSLLFLCAGVFIHGSQDNQDIRLLGGLIRGAPFTGVCFLGCSLALCGFPFISGFYSKDTILEVYMGQGVNLGVYLAVMVATLFTVTYSVRLFFYLIVIAPGLKLFNSGMESRVMVLPITVLFSLAVGRGAAFGWLIVPVFSVIVNLVGRILVFRIMVVVTLLMGGFSSGVRGGILISRTLEIKLGSFKGVLFLGRMWLIRVLVLK